MSSILDGLDWEPVARAPSPDGLPTVTHEGILEIGAYTLRCYRLDDGRAIIHADDFREFFGGLGIEPASTAPVAAASSKPPNAELSRLPRHKEQHGQRTHAGGTRLERRVGRLVPERTEDGTPICPWCEQPIWDYCRSQYDTMTCVWRPMEE